MKQIILLLLVLSTKASAQYRIPTDTNTVACNGCSTITTGTSQDNWITGDLILKDFDLEHVWFYVPEKSPFGQKGDIIKVQWTADAWQYYRYRINRGEVYSVDVKGGYINKIMNQ